MKIWEDYVIKSLNYKLSKPATPKSPSAQALSVSLLKSRRQTDHLYYKFAITTEGWYASAAMEAAFRNGQCESLLGPEYCPRSHI